MMVTSLYGDVAGVGISGSFPSSCSSSFRGGAPKAADGSLLLDSVDSSRALGLGRLPDNGLREMILGG